MAVFLSRAQQAYAPGTRKVTATIPDGTVVNLIRVTLTRVSWPAGPVGSATLNLPDGTSAGVTFNGGDIPNRDGQGILAATTCEFSGASPFPAGQYELVLTNSQALTTAFKVERF